MLQGILYVLIFLVEVAVFARVRSRSARQGALLAGSYALYFTWGAWFAAVLIVSTAMNYLLGEWVRRKPYWPALSIGILLNLALLSSFKYLPGFAISLPFSSLQKFAHVALPLGISFWTFQAMSYLFDLYRGEELDPSFVEFALYMVFFPVAISGPICRLPEMLPQFRSERVLVWGETGAGLARIAIGVLMMQLARLLGQGILAGDGINSGFDSLKQWGGADVWCLAFGYGLQLFFNFAGYSHIAIGAAKVLGFAVPENFAKPFQSASPSIFWTRWHMSLSFWIRDYVFLPLAVMRREMWWRNLILVLSMVIFGIWHKATLLFVLWGCYHGFLLLVHRQVQQLQRRLNWKPTSPLWQTLAWAATITLVSLGWIFFRANSLATAGQMFAAVVFPTHYRQHFLSVSLYLLVVIAAGGYALVLLVANTIERYSGAEVASISRPKRGIVALLVRERWFWIPPLYAIALFILLLVNLTQGSSTAQLMYRKF